MDTATQVKYEQQKLNIESAQIKIEDLESQIDDLKDVSTSPANGVIISKSVEDGDVAKASTALLKVADVTKLIVDAKVSEYEASQIVIGQTVKITSDGIADKVYNGKVISIEPTAATSGTEVVVPITVSIDNSDLRLRPGYTVDLEITTADAKGVLCVPIASILTEKSTENKKYVFTVDENRNLKKAYVTTGVSSDMSIEIKTGLNEGDEVIASPSSSMKEGQSLDSLPSISNSSKGGTKNAQNSGFMQGVPAGNAGGGSGRQGGPGGF
jgi:HlyD family secretion protein